jgi:hypothetical protein
MRSIASATILSLLITSSTGAFAASQSALAPGKPAGIKKAQDQESLTPLLVFGAAAVGIGIALAVSDNDDATPGTPPPTTTTTTTTAP